MGLFKKRKKITSIEEELGEETPKVRVYDKRGKELEKGKMGAEEKRMADLLEVVSMAGQTKRYLVCVTVHDPEGKLKRGGGDLHHWVFQQDFPQDDRYGCLDEYANLMGLGDR